MTTTSSQPSGPDASSFVLRDAATEPVRSDGAGGPSRLVDARVVAQEGFDRVVFELLGDRPTVEVAYLEEPVPATTDGTLVPADAVVLSVRLSPVQDRLVIDGDEVPTYRGLDRISGDGAPVEALVRGGSDDDSVTWLIVLDEQRPFLVDTLDDPNRVIIDVADR